MFIKKNPKKKKLNKKIQKNPKKKKKKRFREKKFKKKEKKFFRKKKKKFFSTRDIDLPCNLFLKTIFVLSKTPRFFQSLPFKDFKVFSKALFSREYKKIHLKKPFPNHDD